MPILSAFGAAKVLGGSYNAPLVNYSYDFDGSSYITVPSSAQFAPGSGDFTVEFFIYMRSAPSATLGILDFGEGSGIRKMLVGFNTARKAIVSSSFGTYTASSAISLNTWTFVTISRLTSRLYMFYGSTSVQNIAYLATLSNQDGARIGGTMYTSERLNGIISNLRFRVGVGVSSPTVPTAPLTNVANTKILTCQSSTIIDNSTANSGSGWTLTNSGATVTTANPF